MKEIIINENLQGEKLSELLLFVSMKSNKLSLSRYYFGKITQAEFNQIQLEYKSLILSADKKNRIYYNENINGYRELIDDFCGTEMNAKEFFNDTLKEKIESCNSLKYEQFKLEHEEFLNEKYEHFNAKTSEFLYAKFTQKTPVNEGPLSEMCYFIIGDIFRKLMSDMSSLFMYPYQIEATEFEDLTFYNEERIILAICAHENFAYMNLENDEYEELKKLNILCKLKE